MTRKKNLQVDRMAFVHTLVDVCGDEHVFSLGSAIEGSGVTEKQARAWAKIDEEYLPWFDCCLARIEENIMRAGIHGELKPKEIFDLMLANNPAEEERIKRIWKGLDSQVDIAIAAIEDLRYRAREGDEVTQEVLKARGYNWESP